MHYLKNGDGICFTTKENCKHKFWTQYGGWRNLDMTRRTNRKSLWWRDLSFICNLTEEESWFRSGSKWNIGLEYFSELWMIKRDEQRIVKLQWIEIIPSPNLDIHSSRLTSLTSPSKSSISIFTKLFYLHLIFITIYFILFIS